MKFRGEVGDYDLKITEDGSPTLYSSAYQEDCHSIHGAKEETLFTYVMGCEIDRLVCESDNINILEVGFGTGLGYLTTAEFLEERGYKKQFTFYSLEIDRYLLTFAKNFWREKHRLQKFSFFDEGENFTFLPGDATVSLPSLIAENKLPKFDAIYMDAFSPKVNGDLWTSDFLRNLSALAKKETILSTYSAAGVAFRNLSEAGFAPYKVTGFAGKKESIRAKLSI